jgi:hypothetical protein
MLDYSNVIWFRVLNEIDDEILDKINYDYVEDLDMNFVLQGNSEFSRLVSNDDIEVIHPIVLDFNCEVVLIEDMRNFDSEDYVKIGVTRDYQIPFMIHKGQEQNKRRIYSVLRHRGLLLFSRNEVLIPVGDKYIVFEPKSESLEENIMETLPIKKLRSTDRNFILDFSKNQCVVVFGDFKIRFIYFNKEISIPIKEVDEIIASYNSKIERNIMIKSKEYWDDSADEFVEFLQEGGFYTLEDDDLSLVKSVSAIMQKVVQKDFVEFDMSSPFIKDDVYDLIESEESYKMEKLEMFFQFGVNNVYFGVVECEMTFSKDILTIILSYEDTDKIEIILESNQIALVIEISELISSSNNLIEISQKYKKQDSNDNLIPSKIG